MQRRAQGAAWLGGAVLIFVAAGCGFTAAPVRYFEVRPEPGTLQPGARLPSIMVSDFRCVSAYDHLRIVLRKSPVEVVTSRNMQWTTVPGRMLAQGLRSRLQSTGRFTTVGREANPRALYAIEGTVELIELSEKPSPMAHLALQLNVRRTRDGTLISETPVDETRPAKSNKPADGVLALRELYSEVLDRFSDSLIAAVERDQHEHSLEGQDTRGVD